MITLRYICWLIVEFPFTATDVTAFPRWLRVAPRFCPLLHGWVGDLPVAVDLVTPLITFTDIWLYADPLIALIPVVRYGYVVYRPIYCRLPTVLTVTRLLRFSGWLCLHADANMTVDAAPPLALPLPDSRG